MLKSPRGISLQPSSAGLVQKQALSGFSSGGAKMSSGGTNLGNVDDASKKKIKNHIFYTLSCILAIAYLHFTIMYQVSFQSD